MIDHVAQLPESTVKKIDSAKLGGLFETWKKLVTKYSHDSCPFEFRYAAINSIGTPFPLSSNAISVGFFVSSRFQPVAW